MQPTERERRAYADWMEAIDQAFVRDLQMTEAIRREQVWSEQAAVAALRCEMAWERCVRRWGRKHV